MPEDGRRPESGHRDGRMSAKRLPVVYGLSVPMAIIPVPIMAKAAFGRIAAWGAYTAQMVETLCGQTVKGPVIP